MRADKAWVSWKGCDVEHEIVGLNYGEILVLNPVNGEVTHLPRVRLAVSDYALEVILALLDEYVQDAIRNEEPRIADWIVTIAEAKLEIWI